MLNQNKKFGKNLLSTKSIFSHESQNCKRCTIVPHCWNHNIIPSCSVGPDVILTTAFPFVCNGKIVAKQCSRIVCCVWLCGCSLLYRYCALTVQVLWKAVNGCLCSLRYSYVCNGYKCAHVAVSGNWWIGWNIVYWHNTFMFHKAISHTEWPSAAPGMTGNSLTLTHGAAECFHTIPPSSHDLHPFPHSLGEKVAFHNRGLLGLKESSWVFQKDTYSYHHQSSLART